MTGGRESGVHGAAASGLRWDGDLQCDAVWILEVQYVPVRRRLCRGELHAQIGEFLLPVGEFVDGGRLEGQVVQPGVGGVERVTAAVVVPPNAQQRSAVGQGTD